MFAPSVKTFPDLDASYKTLMSSPMRAEEGEADSDGYEIKDLEHSDRSQKVQLQGVVPGELKEQFC